MKLRIAIRLTMVLLGAIYIESTSTSARGNVPVICDWLDCDFGGGNCCRVLVASYDCAEYCWHCDWGGGHDDGYCEILNVPGEICACEPSPTVR